MGNKEEGIVIEAEGSFAYIKAIRHTSCKNCGSCPGDQAMLVKTFNKAKAVPGDHVIFEMNEFAMLKSAFIVFVLPFILLFTGAYIGGVISPTMGLTAQIVGGACGFLISLAILRLTEKRLDKDARQLPIVTQIVK